MKQPLSPKATGGILVAALAVVAVAAFLYFKPSMGPGPEVKPIPYGGAANGQGKYVEEDDIVQPGGTPGGAGAPVGAPSAPASGK